MGNGYFWRRSREPLMKRIYFVTEGITDQIVLQGLVGRWLGDDDFVPNRIQPPSSAYVEGLDSNLSEGWKGVLAWCQGTRSPGPAGRDEALRQADCLFIHVDADVAGDENFRNPALNSPCPPASMAVDWVREHLKVALGGNAPANVVLCVPAQDMEAWIVSALHPELADQHIPIECREEPGALLVQLAPHRLVRRKDDRLRKITKKYEDAVHAIVAGWGNCASGEPPRCSQAARFELEAKQVLGQ